MKILIVSFYKTFPSECGAAAVSFGLFRYLPGPKTLIQLDRKTGQLDLNFGGKLCSIGPLPDNKVLKGFWILTKLTALIRKVRGEAPAVIVMEGAAWSLYYVGFYLALRLSRFRGEIVYHAHNVEFILRKSKNNLFVLLISRWAEGFLVKRCRSFAVSQTDARMFFALYGVKPDLLPNGVDLDRFSHVPYHRVEVIEKHYRLSHPLVLFMGLIGFRPNDEALEFLLKEVFPLVVEKKPKFRLAVLGGKLPLSTDWLINPGMIPFEDVATFVLASDICVAPIFSGSGTRLKILEYMAAGKPVVSTKKGAEGLDIHPGKDIIFAETAMEFSEAILNLNANKDFARSLGHLGRRTVEHRYSWASIAKEFSNSLEEKEYKWSQRS